MEAHLIQTNRISPKPCAFLVFVLIIFICPRISHTPNRTWRPPHRAKHSTARTGRREHRRAEDTEIFWSGRSKRFEITNNSSGRGSGGKWGGRWRGRTDRGGRCRRDGSGRRGWGGRCATRRKTATRRVCEAGGVVLFTEFVCEPLTGDLQRSQLCSV